MVLHEPTLTLAQERAWHAGKENHLEDLELRLAMGVLVDVINSKDELVRLHIEAGCYIAWQWRLQGFLKEQCKAWYKSVPFNKNKDATAFKKPARYAKHHAPNTREVLEVLVSPNSDTRKHTLAIYPDCSDRCFVSLFVAGISALFHLYQYFLTLSKSNTQHLLSFTIFMDPQPKNHHKISWI